MCFHNSMSQKAIKLAARYGRKSDILEITQDIIGEQYHINAFNFPRCPIITTSDEVQVFNWGLIPFWVRTEEDAYEIRKMTLNAKAETIFEKPSFREAIKTKRCLIPSTGYFEWRHEKGKKIPFYIFLKDEEIFSMAGVYDEWVDRATGEHHSTFSLITTDANPLTAYIHNTKKRMPAILSEEDEKKWLDPKLTQEEIKALLHPFAVERMDAYEIENNFVKKASSDKTILLGKVRVES